MIEPHANNVSFTFRGCDSATVVRSVVAATDHLCALEDITLSLLEAIEIPVGESLVALDRRCVEAAEVSVSDGRLRLVVRVRHDGADSLIDLLGDSSDVVTSFFDVSQLSDREFELSGSLT